MPDNADQAVESAEISETVDSVEENEAKASKTYTSEEVDTAIKKRIDKQNAKHAGETAKLQQRIDELEQNLDQSKREAESLKAAACVSGWAAEVSKDTNVPQSILTHPCVHFDSKEEMEGFAKAISEANRQGSVFAPIPYDKGESKSPRRGGKQEFVSSIFSRKE